ncbi:MAG TPA: sugar ABC transporter ATP-binding protein [Clostridiales bacterium]|jgi:ribose transport system ATP-binding protein|nr:sugar ABC transporter ATP-binding protein [Clostridiales bacterium]
MKQEVLRMDRVTRIVDGVTRLNRFSMHIFQGEIMGLLPMNDQGKDELVLLLQKNLPLHYGFVYLEEKLVNSYQKSPMTENAISVIDRQNRLIDDLTVADNIFVLRRGFKKYWIRPRILQDQLERCTREIGVSIPADALVKDLPVYERCVAELLRAVLAGMKLVVVRDISNILSESDLKHFHKLMHHCTRKGFSFLYICAHHEEAFPFCDRISVMEEGSVVLTMDQPFSSDEAIWYRALDFRRPAVPVSRPVSMPVLCMDRVCTDAIHSLSFSVWPGECVVILDRSNTILGDIMSLMNRESKPKKGNILVNGAPCGPHLRPEPGQELGFIPEDPVHAMLFPGMSVLDNLCISVDQRIPRIWLDPGIRRSIREEYSAYLRSALAEQDVRALSHREQYDLIYYRMHLYHPKAVFCMQPFLGADMYLRHHIITLLEMLRKRRISTILLSVNISDSLSIADRLLIVENGRLIREYARDDFHTLSPQEGYDPHRTR